MIRELATHQAYKVLGILYYTRVPEESKSQMEWEINFNLPLMWLINKERMTLALTIIQDITLLTRGKLVMISRGIKRWHRSLKRNKNITFRTST